MDNDNDNKTGSRIIMENWMSRDESEKRKAFMKEFNKYFESWLIWGRPKDYKEPTPGQMYRAAMKYAYVLLPDGGRRMVFVNRDDMKAYALRDDIPLLKEPLEEVAYETFNRWCTSFDL